MPRSTAAYLADIIDACDGLAEVLAGVDLEAYRTRRAIRTSVEREFAIIGEAVGVLSRRDPALAARISHARLIVGFRDRLVHEYPQIDDEAVYSIAQRDAPVLRAECAARKQTWETQTNKRIKLTRHGAGGLTGGRRTRRLRAVR
jgi:uncharacterized protein with HEPN domain